MEALLSTGPTPYSFQLSRPPNLSRLYQADTRPLPQNIKCLMLTGSSKAKENFDADFIMVFNRQAYFEFCRWASGKKLSVHWRYSCAFKVKIVMTVFYIKKEIKNKTFLFLKVSQHILINCRRPFEEPWRGCILHALLLFMSI